MKLSEMKQVLLDGEIQLTKSLGQNFLHDQNQLRRIVAAAGVVPADRILEVGPGLGPLTSLLLDSAGQVVAIEKDRRLFDVLAQKLGSNPKLDLRLGDALDLLRENAHPEARLNIDLTGWKLVANLPYSIASPLLVELSGPPAGLDRITVTLQLEVARRLMALAGDEDYGVLTLLVQLRFEPVEWFKIPAACFFPEPEIDSGCVTLRRRPIPLLPESDTAAFRKIVKRAFSQRRKMMLKLLKQDWPTDRLAAAFSTAKIDSTIRAERVSLEQFVVMTRLLQTA